MVDSGLGKLGRTANADISLLVLSFGVVLEGSKLPRNYIYPAWSWLRVPTPPRNCEPAWRIPHAECRAYTIHSTTGQLTRSRRYMLLVMALIASSFRSGIACMSEA
jgi:hypothetical protein